MNIGDYDSEIDWAHHAALLSLPREERALGILNCAEYIPAFYANTEFYFRRQSPELARTLESCPRISGNLLEKQSMADLFQRYYLDLPIGLHDLPLFWGRAIRELMTETNWDSHPHCPVERVFGWSYVSRVSGFLHIQFSEPLPHVITEWAELGEFILQLHERLEPGPYTEPGRFCEFA